MTHNETSNFPDSGLGKDKRHRFYTASFRMAEIFGVVSGAISLAAMFQQCVECFEYIQLGRHFAQDFGRYRLKLKICERRLTRWGEAVNIQQNPRFNATEPGNALDQEAQAILEEIALLFQTIQKSSKRYEIKASKEDLERLGDESLQPIFKDILSRWPKSALRKKREPGFLKKAAWALYDNKNFEKLIEQASGFLDDLEKIFPVEEESRRCIASTEIEDVVDEESLVLLQEAAAGSDQLLMEAIQKKVSVISVRNYAKDIKSEDAIVRLGNDYSDLALGSLAGMQDRTQNEADSVSAKGSSAVHVGNRYGS